MRHSSVARVALMAAMAASLAPTRVDEFRACAACGGLGAVFSRSRKARRRGAEAPGAAAPARKKCDACGGTGIVAGAPEIPARADVAVVGGGIGGLAVAVALQHRGVGCAVFERDGDADERAAGYGLTMQQGGKALEALGALDAVRAAGTTTGRHVSLDARTGALLGVHGERAAAQAAARRATPAASATHLPRRALRAILLARLRAGTVRWGARLEAVGAPDPATGRRTLVFAGGAEVDCAVVVGADGIRSATRRLLSAEGDAPLRDLGVCVVLGFCDSSALGPHYARDCFEAVDGVARVYAMPYDDDRTMWQLSWRTGAGGAPPRLPDRPSGAALKAAALGIVEAWAATAPGVLAAVRATAPADCTGYPIVDRDAAPARPRGVAFVGDAAHPMAPFKAQGANQALIDGVALARELGATDLAPAALRRNRGVEAALDAYWAAMLPRAKTKVDASRRAAALLHSPAALVAAEGQTRAFAAGRAAAEG